MNNLEFEVNDQTLKVKSIKLYGEELLNPSEAGQQDLFVNGLPLKTRPYTDSQRGATSESGARLLILPRYESSGQVWHLTFRVRAGPQLWNDG